MTTNTEIIFTFLDEYASNSEEFYLERVIDRCNHWLEGTNVPEVQETLTKEQIRKGIQLAILKGMRKNAQPHHQMTPDSIGLFIGYLVQALTKNQHSITLMDLASGTGNLLFSVMNFMDKKVEGIAVELDDLLIRLSAVTSNLLEQQVTLYVQDALRPLFIEPVDMIVSDLPVGYYPDDDNAINFELMPAEGHAFTHHLFIEQAIHYMKPGSFGIFVVPTTLFESDQSSLLIPFLQSNVSIRAVLQLPKTLFKNQTFAKSILVIQRPIEKVKKSPDVLLAEIPDMTNAEQFSLFIRKIDAWTSENI